MGRNACHIRCAACIDLLVFAARTVASGTSRGRLDLQNAACSRPCSRTPSTGGPSPRRPTMLPEDSRSVSGTSVGLANVVLIGAALPMLLLILSGSACLVHGNAAVADSATNSSVTD